MRNTTPSFLNWILNKLIIGVERGVAHISKSNGQAESDLGLEEIDINLVERVERSNARLSAKNSAGGGSLSGIESADLRIPPPARIERVMPISDQESAKRLVKGIAFHNDVVLFTASGVSNDPEAPSRLLNDVLTALCSNIKVVDVSSDNDMHLGLPEKNGQPILPCVYVDGRLIGGQFEVLDAIKNGRFFEALDRATISYDFDVAAGLKNSD